MVYFLAKFRELVAPSLVVISLALNLTSSSAMADDLAKADASALEKLGKLLFEDPALSQPNGTSCATCHVRGLAFTGNNNSTVEAVALGSRPGQFGTRKVPTLMYMAYSPPLFFSGEANEKGVVEQTAKGGQFWDGRADSFIDQARGPLFNAAEMNNANEEALVESLRTSASADEMKKVFGDKVFDNPSDAVRNLALALAAFENSDMFRPFSSKFDRYLEGTEKLSAQEALGFKLFKNKKKGNCISCHAGKEDSNDPTDWLFTDFTYDNLGLPRNQSIPANTDASNFDLGLCKRPGIEKLVPAGVKVEELCGAFKVPTLRDVALRKSFFHNGSFTDLRAAVAFYATRDTNPEKWYPLDANGKPQKLNDLPEVDRKNTNTDEVPYDRKPGQKPRLNAMEIDAIVAFLKTLTDNWPPER